MNYELTRLHDLLNQTLALLDQACALVEPSGVEPRKDTVKMLGRAVGEILHARKGIYDLEPKPKGARPVIQSDVEPIAWVCLLTPRWSGRVIDKVPSPNSGVRAAQLNR